MRLSVESLQKTKAWNDPANRQKIAEALRPRAPVVGAVASAQCEHVPLPALVNRKAAHPRSKKRVVILVEIIRSGRKILDDDNLIAGAKPLRDAIATSFGVDDADPRMRWRYRQCLTEGACGTIVRIERL